MLLISSFQNCSVPFESTVETYDKNSQGINATTSASGHSNDSSNNSFILPKSGPVVYLYQSSEVAMVKDVCLSDNNYVLKVRNSGNNPKLCLTKQSDLAGCINNTGSFVSLTQMQYQKIGTDWVKDGIGKNLRQLILPSQSPMSLAVFYLDDANPTPIQVGGFNIHACIDKTIYNHVSFTCPTEDICGSYFPETTMESGSCVPTTGGVKISCIPRFVEEGSPKSGSFAKFPEPSLANSSGGNTGDSGSIGSPNSGGSGSTGGNAPVSPIATECGEAAGGSIFQFKSTMGYYNVTETGTVAPGTVKSFPFVIDSSKYPYGMSFVYESGFSSGSYNMKDISISKCPGQFEGLPTRCLKLKTVGGYIVTDPVKDVTTCKVEHGVTYYFNIRPSFEGQDAAAVVDPKSR